MILDKESLIRDLEGMTYNEAQQFKEEENKVDRLTVRNNILDDD